MDRFHFLGYSIHDGSMTGEAAHPVKALRLYHHMKMAFAAAVLIGVSFRPRMACMLMALVNHI